MKIAKCLLAAFAVMLTGAAAQSATMNCLVGVYTAQMLAEPDFDFGKVTQMVSVPLSSNNVGDVETIVGGETIITSLIKKPFADLYDVTFALKSSTPVHGRSHIAAMLTDGLYNDGPTKKNGWDLTPGPGHEVFRYFRYSQGAFSFTLKLYDAMKNAGVWGTDGFHSTVVDIGNMTTTAEFVKAQVAAGKLQPTDVVGFASFFSCTRVP